MEANYNHPTSQSNSKAKNWLLANLPSEVTVSTSRCATFFLLSILAFAGGNFLTRTLDKESLTNNKATKDIPSDTGKIILSTKSGAMQGVWASKIDSLQISILKDSLVRLAFRLNVPSDHNGKLMQVMVEYGPAESKKIFLSPFYELQSISNDSSKTKSSNEEELVIQMRQAFAEIKNQSNCERIVSKDKPMVVNVIDSKEVNNIDIQSGPVSLKLLVSDKLSSSPTTVLEIRDVQSSITIQKAFNQKQAPIKPPLSQTTPSKQDINASATTGSSATPQSSATARPSPTASVLVNSSSEYIIK